MQRTGQPQAYPQGLRPLVLQELLERLSPLTITFTHCTCNTQDNLKRIPKASALWFSKNFWSVSGRFGADYYHGLFQMKGGDLKAADRALVNKLQ